MIYGREDRISTPVSLADESVYIPRDDPLASYLDIEAIVAAAKEVGADAVHPGYGFLAENPTFAKRSRGGRHYFHRPQSRSSSIIR